MPDFQVSALRALTRAAAWACAAALLSAALVKGSLEHPFLVADNRHYTFYLWRKVLGPRGLLGSAGARARARGRRSPRCSARAPVSRRGRRL